MLVFHINFLKRGMPVLMDFRHRKNSFLFKSLSSFLIVSFVVNQVAFGNPVEAKIAPFAAPGITTSLEDFVTVSDVIRPRAVTAASLASFRTSAQKLSSTSRTLTGTSQPNGT